MDRRNFLLTVAGVAAVPALFAGSLRRLLAASDEAVPTLQLDQDTWRQILTPPQFHVLREEGTERAFTSPLNDEKRDGKFICAGCNLPLFDSATKYDSRTGWPSFYQALDGGVGTKTDYKIGYPRTEYHCSRCGGHQGHIFDDGPQPTGKRYCNNGIALYFVPAGDQLPELRS